MAQFLKLISYPLSVIHYFFFGLLLLVFHPIQWLAFNVFGKNAHRETVIVLNKCLTFSLYFLFSRVKFINKHKIPENVPLIIVSNHQSTYDIPPMYAYLGKYYPNFVSKIELGKGIPSVSYNLRHGNNVLIDRKDRRQSINALMNFGEKIEKEKLTAVIFPEGTRSKTAVPKPFRENGLKMMVKKAPSCFVIPLSINNSWRLVRKGAFPLGVGIKVTMEVHEPIKADSIPFPELMEKTENQIKEALLKLNPTEA
ncbi:lysophospholipid acyltransferase family protein [Lutimonas zeaxanthinifaciens]|uniref:lysophospholipid acyltransferase family protein n=1 Tax=Lutimonas zeaxanthinifaciens TaxID=3060215 RepID=UPI00265D1C9C|nr:lysophospholipid acyltransferase family protein [Lutimonas sp. YSD2104]WKK65988.1 lysophospholipid acyltransferase family protein [Lutimonas sp. YSD2104]